MFRDTSLKFKLFVGFFSILVFVAIAGGTGYWSVNTLGNAMKIIVEEEAPIVDASMEMKITVANALMNMDEFKGATAVLATDNKDELPELIKAYQQGVEDYDMFTDLILNGGTWEGTTFIATDNETLRLKAEEADKLHNDEFQPIAARMHKTGKGLIADKEKRDNSMEEMEKIYFEIVKEGGATEEAIKVLMSKRVAAGDFAGTVQNEARWADLSMEIIITINEARIAVEEIAQSTELAQLEEVVKEYEETLTSFDKWIVALLNGGQTDMGVIPRVTDAGLRAQIEKLDVIHDKKFQPAINDLITAQKDVIAAQSEMDNIIEEVDGVGERQTALLGEIEKLAAEEMAIAKEKGFSAWSFATTAMIVVFIIALVLGIVIGIVVTSAIAKPILRIIADLTEGSTQVSSAAGQISQSSQSLAEGSTEQASSLEETSSSLEEIAGMTRQNADNANNANSLMKDSKKMVDSGVSQMREMTEAMDSIKESSGEISKIIKVIEEIAFQTNLLALNAAVEAARAGEHGKGFAVVAEEVRNLAQRSATASKDTAVLIENAVKKATDGSEIVKKVAEALSAISESTKKVGDLVGEIAAASNEQATGVDQVNQAVGQMDQVTQTNAANAEESASASEELNAQADNMNGVVGDLYRVIHGAGGNGESKRLQPAEAVPKLKTRVKGLPAPKKEKAAPPKKRAPKVVKEADEVIPFDD